jgi:hypothetical protein
MEEFEARFGRARAWALDQGLEPEAIAALDAALLEPAPGVSASSTS